MVTETWLNQGEIVIPLKATPPIFSHLHQPMLSGRGGRVAVIHKSDFKCYLFW